MYRSLLKLRHALLCAALVFASGCHSGSSGASSASPIQEVREGYGVACDIVGVNGPTSYPVSVLGKPGVPDIGPQNTAMLRRIMRYVHPKTLRFAFVSGEFIVYDATDGPCSRSTPYYVLNAKSCNEGYAPIDRPDHTFGLGDCLNPPRPWIPNDRGSGTGSWNNYDNSH